MVVLRRRSLEEKREKYTVRLENFTDIDSKYMQMKKFDLTNEVYVHMFGYVSIIVFFTLLEYPRIFQ